MKRIAVFGSFIALFISVFAYSHGVATGIVKERMDFMSSLGDAMKTLKPIFQGKTEYDAEVIREQALILAKLNSEHMSQMFPEDSFGTPSEARKEVWLDWETFSAKADELNLLAQGLYHSAENKGKFDAASSNTAARLMKVSQQGELSLEHMSDLTGSTVFIMIGKNCSACHKQFRREKKK